jgi:hypothetical protein
MATQREFDEATARGEEMFRTLPRVVAVRFDAQSRLVIVDLHWGYSIAFPPERSQDLHDATPEELAEVEISGPGWSIYFPKLDTDLWVPAMVEGRFGNARWEAAWAEAHPFDKAA